MKRIVPILFAILFIVIAFSVAGADVPRGDIYHHPDVYLYDHPCVSIESHLREHPLDVYLGGECEFDDDPPGTPEPVNYYLPVVFGGGECSKPIPPPDCPLPPGVK